jgi:hypothetical protein
MKTKEEIEQLAKQSAQEKYRLQHIPLEQIDEYGGEIATYVSVFINAYTQCQEDSKDKKYTEEDLIIAFDTGYYTRDAFGDRPNNMTAEEYINSLNKQD